MSNPYAPPSVTEPIAGKTFRWRIAHFTFITLGLTIPVIGGTLVVHTIRLTTQARQAQREAMYQQDLAQKAVEQAELLQRKSSESPTRD